MAFIVQTFMIPKKGHRYLTVLFLLRVHLNFQRNKVYELWEFAEFDENENNKIEIRVNWKESNKQHSQVLKLKMYYGRTNYILRRVKRFLL